MAAPYRFERAAWRRGLTRVAGLDEAGRGPLAGPVVAAAVILAPGTVIKGVDDSKRLTAEQRERLFEVIAGRAAAVAVGIADAATIDRINVLEATRLAMRSALRGLEVEPELVLTDFVALDGLGCPQRNLVRGDQRSATVAAASIVAKVTRDRIMEEADREFPQYGFGRHKGYPTEEHRAALAEHGPCPLHRRRFRGVEQFEPGRGRRAGEVPARAAAEGEASLQTRGSERRHGEAGAESIQGELFPITPLSPQRGEGD